MSTARISPADVTIRPLLEADVGAARAAAAAALEQHYPEDVSPQETLRVESGIARVAHLQRTDPDGCRVAELDGEIIGAAIGLIREGVWGFSLFGLLPAYQGRGIGSRLYAPALQYGAGQPGGIILSEIRQARGLRDFAEVARELEDRVDARAWTTGDGPKALFNDAIGWLFERNVLLPGVTTLARLVARVRDEATLRLWDTLAGLLTARQCRQLEGLLTVSDGGRFSDLERGVGGPAKPSGRNLERAIARVAEIKALGLAGAGLDGVVAHRRLVDLARYGDRRGDTLLRPADRRVEREHVWPPNSLCMVFAEGSLVRQAPPSKRGAGNTQTHFRGLADI